MRKRKWTRRKTYEVKVCLAPVDKLHKTDEMSLKLYHVGSQRQNLRFERVMSRLRSSQNRQLHAPTMTTNSILYCSVITLICRGQHIKDMSAQL